MWVSLGSIVPSTIGPHSACSSWVQGGLLRARALLGEGCGGGKQNLFQRQFPSIITIISSPPSLTESQGMRYQRENTQERTPEHFTFSPVWWCCFSLSCCGELHLD